MYLLTSKQGQHEAAPGPHLEASHGQRPQDLYRGMELVGPLQTDQQQQQRRWRRRAGNGCVCTCARGGAGRVRRESCKQGPVSWAMTGERKERTNGMSAKIVVFARYHTSACYIHQCGKSLEEGRRPHGKNAAGLLHRHRGTGVAGVLEHRSRCFARAAFRFTKQS